MVHAVAHLNASCINTCKRGLPPLNQSEKAKTIGKMEYGASEDIASFRMDRCLRIALLVLHSLYSVAVTVHRSVSQSPLCTGAIEGLAMSLTISPM